MRSCRFADVEQLRPVRLNHAQGVAREFGWPGERCGWNRVDADDQTLVYDLPSAFDTDTYANLDYAPTTGHECDAVGPLIAGDARRKIKFPAEACEIRAK